MSPSVEPFDEAKYKALMDGLNIKEYSFSETLNATDYFRLEADYFTAQNLQGNNILFAEKYIDKVQYGTSEFLNEDKQGYPILRLNEFETYFIKEPAKYCNLISQQQYNNLKLRKGDVLVCRTNGNPDLVGRAAVIMEDCNYAFASYLFRVNVNNDITPETFVAYLQCKYGRIEIDKNSMKGNQTNFSPSKLKDVKIPHFSIELCLKITNIFEKAYNASKKAKESYTSADKLLSGYLGIATSKNDTVSIKSLSQSFTSFGRLDAEFYQPKYDMLFDKLSEFTTFQLGGKNGLVDIKKSIEPGSDYYQEEGIPFIRVSDIDKFEIGEPNIKLPHDVVTNAESLYPQKDTILFSKDGSVGIAHKVQEDMKAITSSALLHLTIKNTDVILPDYLTIVLNSPIVQLQAERDTNGAIIQHWRPSDIEKVVIPVLDMEVQKEISEKVQESFELRKESKRMLECAVKAVEMAIESDENTAIRWLEMQL